MNRLWSEEQHLARRQVSLLNATCTCDGGAEASDMGESLYIRRTGTRCLGLGLKDLDMSGLELVTLFVESYDPAIEFFVDKLGFALVEDSPSLTNDGRPEAVGRRAPAWRSDRNIARAGRWCRPSFSCGRSGRRFALASSCGWMISIRPSNGWCPRVSNSLPLHAPNHTARSLCFSTSPATAGTCSALREA